MDVVHTKRLLYYQRCPFSVFELDVRQNWWVMASNTHCSHVSVSHLCVLTCISWKYRSYMDIRSAYWTTALLLDAFLVCFRLALESYRPRYTSVILWNNIVCTYTSSPYIYCYLVHIYAWQQNSRTVWLHTTHQMMALLPTMYCFIKAKLDSYTTSCSLFN